MSDDLKIIRLHGRDYVLRPQTRGLNVFYNQAVSEPIPNANFAGTGMALYGVLKKRETLDGYRKRRVNQFRELLKNNEKIREKL